MEEMSINTQTNDSDLLISDLILSTDGKKHQVTINRTEMTMEFILLRKKKENIVMKKDLNELICASATPIRLKSGIPVDLNKNANHKDTPNLLFLYFAENIYGGIWRIREVTLIFMTSTEKKWWFEAVNSAISELVSRPKRLLIFINPYGGKGKAKKIYDKNVAMILELAGIRCDIFLTERANHAFDHLRQIDNSLWHDIDGVISVGGDGLFNECMSAILYRTQEETSIDINDVNVESLKKPRMRFGIIGAGSANSIVSSVHGTKDYSTAAIHIAIGSQCSVDVCTVHKSADLLRISANAISYGFLGDAINESEHYRWMGPLRYNYCALRTLIRHRQYSGRVSFKLIPELEGQAVAPSVPKCTDSCSLCANPHSILMGFSGIVQDGVYPHHVYTNFVHIICCVIPCVSPFTPHGLAPYTGIGDGTMDLALISGITRRTNLRFMTKVWKYGGKNLVKIWKIPNLNVFRVSQWMFTPESLMKGDTNKASVFNDSCGVWNLDGEILHQPYDAALQFRLHTRALKYFGRELDIDYPTKKRKCYCALSQKKFSSIVALN